MKKLYLILFLATLGAINSQVIDSAWLSNNYTKTETYIKMRDGIKLYTCIYAPKNNSEKQKGEFTKRVKRPECEETINPKGFLK